MLEEMALFAHVSAVLVTFIRSCHLIEKTTETVLKEYKTRMLLRRSQAARKTKL